MLIPLLRTFLAPYRRTLVIIVALQFVGTIAMMFLPALNADIIDNGIVQGDVGYIIRVGLIMLGVSLIQIVCSITAVYFGSRTAMGYGRDLRSAIFHRVLSLSGREVTSFGAPSLITRTTNDVQQVQMLVMLSATMMVSAPIMMVGGVVMAMRQDLGLSWIVAVSLPALFVVIGLVVSQMVPGFRIMQDRIDAVNRTLREQITGIRVVRAFVREEHETRRFAQANTELTAVALSTGRWMALMLPGVILVVNLAIVAVFWFGGQRVDDGSMQIGSLTAFMSYLMQIMMSVMMATFMLVTIPRATACADRISEVLDTVSSVPVAATPTTNIEGRGVLTFADVGFTYPGAEHPVLQRISFTATPGTTTAIIGSTGAGKSTLVNLVPRIFDVTEGVVALDGVDVRDLDPDLLWRQVGLVPQQAYLFSGTVRSNLLHGRADATDDELWEALEVAQAADFVRAMDGALDAAISQGGTNVSGGQRQRLAIARAIVKRPPLYVFDDSFSALDVATDARLRRALLPWTRESTVLVVAQRVSTIREADQILVVEDGEIVGRGSHDDLLATCTTYAEIVRSQRAAEVTA